MAVSNAAQLRTRVSSDLEMLQYLHEETGWTPGAENIRPEPHVRAQKVCRTWLMLQVVVCAAPSLPAMLLLLAVLEAACGEHLCRIIATAHMRAESVRGASSSSTAASLLLLP